MKSLFLALVSTLAMALVVPTGKALAEASSHDGGFCRGVSPSAMICQEHQN